MQHAIIDPYFIIIGRCDDAVFHALGAVPHVVIAIAVRVGNRTTFHFEGAIVREVRTIPREPCRKCSHSAPAISEHGEPIQGLIRGEQRSIEPLTARNSLCWAKVNQRIHRMVRACRRHVSNSNTHTNRCLTYLRHRRFRP